MLIVKDLTQLKFYGFNYYTTSKNGHLIDERYVYENSNGYTLAELNVKTYPEMVIKNYSCNQEFVEKVFPKMVKAGVVEYVEDQQ